MKIFPKTWYCYLTISLLSSMSMTTIYSSAATNLHELVHGGISQVRDALNSQTVTIDTTNKNGESLLDIASTEGDVTIVKHLLLQIKNGGGEMQYLVNNALIAVIKYFHYGEEKQPNEEEQKKNEALKKSKMTMIDILVNEGNAQFQEKDKHGHTAFIGACSAHLPEVVGYFVKKGGLGNDQLKKGLKKAMGNADLKTVAILLNDTDINCSTEEANELLKRIFYYDTIYKSIEEVFDIQKLADHFTDENQAYQEVIDQLFRNFLINARKGQLEKPATKEILNDATKLFKRLIDEEKIAVTGGNATAVFLCAYMLARLDNNNKNYKGLVSSFLQQESFKQEHIGYIVTLSCLLGDLDEIKKWMDGKDHQERQNLLNTHVTDHMTALMAACMGQQLEVVKKLVNEYDVNVNASNEIGGATPLMVVAARRKREDILVSIPSQTWYLKEEKDLEIVKYLLDNGADINMVIRGKTVDIFAQEAQNETGSNERIIQYLKEYRRTHFNQGQNGSNETFQQTENRVNINSSQDENGTNETVEERQNRENRKKAIKIIAAILVIIAAITGMTYGYLQKYQKREN